MFISHNSRLYIGDILYANYTEVKFYHSPLLTNFDCILCEISSLVSKTDIFSYVSSVVDVSICLILICKNGQYVFSTFVAKQLSPNTYNVNLLVQNQRYLQCQISKCLTSLQNSFMQAHFGQLIMLFSYQRYLSGYYS